LKEWVVNCISLAEYYTTVFNYNQAYYLLNSALQEIPTAKKNKLRATVQMSLGKFFSSMLFHNVKFFTKSTKEEFIDEKKVLFSNKVEWFVFKMA
jgi:hypothetical protein